MRAAPSFALQQLQWGGLGSTLDLPPSHPSSIEVDEGGHARARYVLPDSGHLPLGQCPSPGGFSKPPPAWLTMARTSDIPMWLIQPELGSRIGQTRYNINGY